MDKQNIIIQNQFQNNKYLKQSKSKKGDVEILESFLPEKIKD
jgi:hypothetical protein